MPFFKKSLAEALEAAFSHEKMMRDAQMRGGFKALIKDADTWYKASMKKDSMRLTNESRQQSWDELGWRIEIWKLKINLSVSHQSSL